MDSKRLFCLRFGREPFHFRPTFECRRSLASRVLLNDRPMSSSNSEMRRVFFVGLEALFQFGYRAPLGNARECLGSRTAIAHSPVSLRNRPKAEHYALANCVDSASALGCFLSRSLREVCNRFHRSHPVPHTKEDRRCPCMACGRMFVRRRTLVFVGDRPAYGPRE